MKRLFIALVPVLLLVAACGSDDDEPTSASSADSAPAHNDADVEFAQGMIPHHRQAVDMAEMARTQAQSQEVLQLADTIEAAQAPEIATLEGWLEDWGEPVEAGMDHGSMGMSGGGMMSDDEMSQLMAAQGAEFDRMFLEMMIQHHRGAIDMAETELEEGEFPDAVEMAQTIKDTQEGEIAEMEQLLTTL